MMIARSRCNNLKTRIGANRILVKQISSSNAFDCGAYRYEGFRHSFCHGWASGPTAWLSQNVLGVKPLAPGFKRVRIVPQLGNLKWAEGTYPTPLGPIKVRHERRPDGSIKSKIETPPGVEVEQRR